MTKIGISYITYNRPDLWKFGFTRLMATLKPHLDKYEFIISISDDNSDSVDILEDIITKEILPYCPCTLNTGLLGNIAHCRNRSLLELTDCDFIFLFEDDIYPINEDWLEGYLSVLSQPNFGHIMYLPSSIFPNETQVSEVNGRKVMINTQCGGIMLALTKNILDMVGGFYAEFGPYGYEHAEYTERCNLAQNLPWDHYLTIKEAETEHWFISADEFNKTSFSADITSEEFRLINKGSIGQRLELDKIKQSINFNAIKWKESRIESDEGKYYRGIVWPSPK